MNALKTSIPEIQITFKNEIPAKERPKIHSSKDSEEILRANFEDGTIELREYFKVLYLNRANQVIGIYHLSSGSIAGTVVEPRLIFAAGLKCLCSGIVLCHNHPSSNLKPSRADITLTDKLVKAAKLLDMQILDHIILTNESYLSFADDGLL